MTRVTALLILQACFGGSAIGPTPPADDPLIAYVKSLNASQLDDSLPSQRLDDWLRDGALGVADVNWKISRDCDVKPNGEGPEEPICVKFGFTQHDVTVGATIMVDGHSSRLAGKAHFEHATAVRMPMGADRRRFVKMLSLLPAAVAELAALPPRMDSDAILAYAKALDVAQLDPSLASGRLEDWLRSGPARGADVEWHIAPDCPRASGASVVTGSRLCVAFSFKRPGVVAWGVVAVGTVESGVVGSPRFEYATAGSEGGSDPRRVSRLSEFPRVVSEILPRGRVG